MLYFLVLKEVSFLTHKRFFFCLLQEDFSWKNPWLWIFLPRAGQCPTCSIIYRKQSLHLYSLCSNHVCTPFLKSTIFKDKLWLLDIWNSCWCLIRLTTSPTMRLLSREKVYSLSITSQTLLFTEKQQLHKANVFWIDVI